MKVKKLLVMALVMISCVTMLFASPAKEEATKTDEPINIVFLTHKENEEATFARYIAEFQKSYPNVNITYEPIHDYKSNIEIRWTSGDWGDMCMIPHQFLTESELPNLFASLGTVDEFDAKYEFASAFSFEGQVYGISSTGTAYGVLYNKAVLEKAGVTSMPKSPEEFYAALEKVKANTDSIPLYVNYGAGSRLADWEWNARGSLTADANYKNKLIYMVNPFEKGKPYYTVMEMLYNVVKMGLVEDDPATSNWDTCKNLLAQGKVACTVIGSWATIGTQQACETPEDIVFAAFPWNIDGKQYATIAADYAYAINKNVTGEKLEACKAYIKYLSEDSNFSYDYGGIPIMKGQDYPATLTGLKDADVTLVLDNPPLQQDAGLFDEVNSESELYLGKYPQKARIVEAAMGQSDETFDQIMDDWNKRWTSAQIAVLGPDYASASKY